MASAILKIAAAHAKAGDRKTAIDIASRIQLPRDRSLLAHFGIDRQFDYRLPGTWGVCYEPAFTNASTSASEKDAAEVAAAAMILALALGQKPARPYEESFNDIVIYTGEIMRSLARTDAASGNVNEALTWARRVGAVYDPACLDLEAHRANGGAPGRVQKGVSQ